MADETEIKPKKPIWRKWWFWAIAIFVVIAIIGFSSNGKQEVRPEQQSSQQQTQTQERIGEKEQADAKQALIKKRQNFNSKRGNNYEAASTAQGFMDIFKTEMPNVGIDMYLKLIANDKDEKAYENGGDLDQYRNKVYAAELFVVMDETAWDLAADNDKKDLVAGFVNALHNLYPKSTTISAKVNNGIRTVAEGSWSFWNGEAEVKLK